MKDRGYYGVGVFTPKTEHNYWSLFRTAQILDADFLFVIGPRFRMHPADVMGSYRHIPTYSYLDFKDFNSHRPFDCRLIGVELQECACEVSRFVHPKRAIYLLGAEDNGLSKECLSHCQDVIRLHGERSMNVAVAGSIVLYDRYAKQVAKDGNP